MFKSKSKPENRIIVDGIVMRPSWKETFLTFKRGEERTFDRHLFTTASARTLAAKLNSIPGLGMRFSVRVNGMEDSCTVRREE